MPTIRSEPCRNCQVEIYLDTTGDAADRDWVWKHVPEALRRVDCGDACAEPEPEPRRRRGSVFRVGRGEL